jgi:hypothetical protein
MVRESPMPCSRMDAGTWRRTLGGEGIWHTPAAGEERSRSSARETEASLYARWSVALFNYGKAASQWQLESSQRAGGAHDARNSSNPGDDGGSNREPATNVHQDGVIAC